MLVGESFIKAYLEELIFAGNDSSNEQGFANFPALVQSTGNKGYIRDDDPPTPRPAEQLDSLPWESTRPHDKAFLGKEVRHHCLLYGPDATSSTHDSSVPLNA